MPYQVKNTVDLQTWISPIQLAYPYTLVEFRENFDKHYKLLALAAQQQGWKNALDLGFNFFQKIYYRNLTVRQFLEYQQISKENIDKFLEQYHKRIEISLEGNDKFLSLAENKQSIIHFFALSENNSKIIINTGWYYASHFILISDLIDNFVNNGGECIRVLQIHHDRISEAFEYYCKEFETDKDKIQVFYFTDKPLYWIENE